MKKIPKLFIKYVVCCNIYTTFSPQTVSVNSNTE